MTKDTYSAIESYMLSCMDDAAHDKEHVYRVLFNALEIAACEPEVDYDILITACLLHDIGRADQLADPSLCHAAVGSEKAYAFLLEQGFPQLFAQNVKHCILSHRFRRNAPPQSLEAKILFDADKLDVTGAIGIARTLEYQGRLGLPLYTLLPDGSVSAGEANGENSFFQEYAFKLEKLYDRFYTQKGAELAQCRRESAAAFCQALYTQVSYGYISGKETLKKLLE